MAEQTPDLSVNLNVPEGHMTHQQNHFPATSLFDGLTEGRVVHFVLPDGTHRPATVVRNWTTPSGMVNLQVLLDGTNDNKGHLPVAQGPGWPSVEECLRGMCWRASVRFDPDGKAPGTWHWPERA